VNIDRLGNTSGASIAIAMDEAYRDGRIKTGDNILLVGFGAGFSLGAAVLRWGK
jgi:3-oxoacyl-[acyl-carrier-protein] synthase-3